jgi:succinate dehydrogenase/fumarate reductase cytochrome b subunit
MLILVNTVLSGYNKPTILQKSERQLHANLYLVYLAYYVLNSVHLFFIGQLIYLETQKGRHYKKQLVHFIQVPFLVAMLLFKSY